VPFSKIDLSGIHIPGANLSSGIFDGTNFESANLSGVNFQGSWLRNTNFKNSNMTNVYFGEFSYKQFDQSINSCTYSKNGCYFAAAAGTKIITYKIKKSGNLIFYKELVGDNKARILSVAFSQDSLLLASGCEDCSTYLWEFKSDIVKKLTAHTNQVRSVAFSYENQWLASGGIDKKLCFWNIKNIVAMDLAEPQYLSSDNPILSAVFSQNNKWLSLSDGETISLYNIVPNNNSMVVEFFKKLTITTALFPIDIVFDPNVDFSPNMDFSPNSKWLASGRLDSKSDDIKKYDWKMEEISNNIKPQILTGHTSFVKSITFSPNNQWLASASRDNTICFWSTEELGSTSIIKPKKTILGHNYPINAITFSPNGEQLASGSDEKTVRIWNVTNIVNQRTMQLQTAHTDYVRSVAFGPTNKWFISGSGDGTVRLWDKTSPNKNQILINNTLSVLSIALRPNDKYLAFSDDKKITIWKHDISNGNGLISCRTITDHTSSVLSLAFSKNSQWLISGSRDKTVRVYNLDDLSNSLVDKCFHIDVYSVTFNQNNKFFVLG
ncbi:MAG: WD40 repeat domain-containing protein, partial [Gammaproteobacteria bacterium]